LLASESFLKPETIIFLGAGASIYAGINGVIKLVEDFNEWLQLNRKVDYLDINRKIIDIIKKSESENMNGNTEIDIEDLLMTVEKLENSSKDILLDFYEGSFPILSTCNGYNLISGGKTLLSQEIKNFIKTTFTEKGLNVDYLKPLVDLVRDYRPLHIFSTNYDTCIERFCLLNDLKYVDGFNPQWDLNQFNRTDIDVRLYKLHGSIGWFRSEQGDYVRSDVKIGGTRARLNTNQDVVPLILYPGKKFEYIEPMFDMLLEFKRQLDYAKYVFVVGYSFKDDHLSKLFRYAAKRNPHMTIFLITPSSHDIYYHSLKRHGDAEFIHSYSHESYSMLGYNTTQPTKLEGNVICLPYKFENVIHLLNKQYLVQI
jgi:SIR2-like protein